MHCTITRLGRILRLVLDSLDLLFTLQPGLAGPRSHKLFSAPSHAGGPATKYQQLSAACAGRGEPYSTVICLSSVQVPLPVLRLLRWRGARIVVNQNGVYYPLWFPEGYEARNQFLRQLNELAHHSFFQSEFALRSFEKWVGPAPASRSILHNAVDRSRFTPQSDRKSDPNCLRVLLFHDFRALNADLWAYFFSLPESLTGVEWVILGQAVEPGLVERARKAFPPGTTEWHLDPTPTEVTKAIPTCDVALQFVHNDVCPNKVLECLAAGVYVLCCSAGGARELVAQGGGEMLPVSDGYDERSYPEPSLVRKSLDRFRSQADTKRQDARNASARFDIAPWTKIMTGGDRA